MQLNKKTGEHKKKYYLKLFKTRKDQRSKGKGVHAGADNDASTGVGGGDTSAADSKDLKAYGYKVKSEVIINNKGDTFELFFKVW